MMRHLVVVLALCLAIRAQETTVGQETVAELTLDEIDFPDGYEWLVISLQQVQVPELNSEQLAELEEKMTEEHFQFIMQMIDGMRLNGGDLSDYYEDWTTLTLPEIDTDWPWVSEDFLEDVTMELPDESHLGDDGYITDYYTVPLWVLIGLPILGLLAIMIIGFACCRKREPSDVKYQSFDNDAEEKKVPIV